MFILKKHNAFYMFKFMAKVEINLQTKFKFSFATTQNEGKMVTEFGGKNIGLLTFKSIYSFYS